MVFDKDGRKTGHKFVRGLMRSPAKLSYEQAQAAIDGVEKGGGTDDATGPIMDTILYPLWNAYHTMLKGRLKRAPAADRERRAPHPHVARRRHRLDRAARLASRPTG